MTISIQLLNILLPVLYALCLLAYGICFVKHEDAERCRARSILRIVLFVHLAYMVLVALHYSRAPMGNLCEAMSVLGFSVAAVYAYLEARTNEESAGVFILIFVFAFQVISSSIGSHEIQDPFLPSSQVVFLHIALALFSYSSLAISAIFSAMYLMLYNEIKSHRFGLVYSRLPSLEKLGSFCYQGALVGFVLLTAAVLSGVMRASTELSRPWDQQAKVMAVLISWMIYGVLICLKSFRGWQGKRIAFFSLAGFAVTLISLVIAFHALG